MAVAAVDHEEKDPEVVGALQVKDADEAEAGRARISDWGCRW